MRRRLPVVALVSYGSAIAGGVSFQPLLEGLRPARDALAGFVAALRHVPLFPRLLAAIWGMDILMQTLIARAMGSIADLPPAVAVALHELLEGNLKKVLISMALWTPYLLLSRRVNLTYRSRVPA